MNEYLQEDFGHFFFEEKNKHLTLTHYSVLSV
jgi:hypothetical protein